MFPDITRDDVFRIETPRLWLRWPERRDCAAIRAYASCFAVADMTSSVPHPYPEGEAERFVAQVRASNSVGKTLELMIEHKSTRTVIGTVLVRFGQDQRPYIGYALHPDFLGQGYASEAAKALVDVVFLLTETDAMTATARSDKARTKAPTCNYAAPPARSFFSLPTGTWGRHLRSQVGRGRHSRGM